MWSPPEIHKGNIVGQIDEHDLSFLEHATDIDIFGQDFSSAFSGLAGSHFERDAFGLVEVDECCFDEPGDVALARYF